MKVKNNKIVERARLNKKEFVDFMKKYNVMELAIGVVIGGAVKDLVASIANDLIMPIVGIVTPDGSWRSIVIKIAGSEFRIGNFIGSLLNFLIIALVVFIVIKKILGVKTEK